MTQIYDALARYYDLLYSNKDYLTEAEFVSGLIRRHQPAAKTILELGCGTGAHAQHLAEMGFIVEGVDLSPAMLQRAEARRSALPANVSDRLSFRRGDLRSFRADREYDAVVSLFNVMSYLTLNEDLEAAFETAASHLRPGGIFLFDFWHGPAVLTQQPEVRVKSFEDDEIKLTRTAEPELHLCENKVRLTYTLDVKSKAGADLESKSEAHDIRYLFAPEIEYLSKSFFKMLEIRGFMKDQPPGVEDWSAICILLRKP